MAHLSEPGSAILRKWKAERELERALKARTHKQMRAPGFAAGAIDRLNVGLSHWSGSLNSDLDRSLAMLRAGGRRLGANVSHGRRFLTLVKNNVVGLGPRLQVRAKNAKDGALDKPGNDAIESHWDKWCRRADIAGRMGFAHLLRVLVASVARDGEALVRVVRNRRLAYGMALQLLEADRLDETINKILDNGAVIRQGVEIDSTGRPLAYYIKSVHPGEAFQSSTTTIERVPARDVYHVFVQERAEQVRGFTWFHAVLRELDMHYGYKEAALVAARVGAAKMAILTRKDADAPPPALQSMADGQDAATGALQMNGEPGEFLEAPPGYALESWDPDYPHANFESFVTACLREVASGLDVAAHNLTGNMTDVNYSSARIAELAERDVWTALQDWLHEHLLVPLYQDWLASALLLGEIKMQSGIALPAERLEKFLDVSKFQGRRWGWVDPMKEASAFEKLVGLGLTSRTAIAASQGREYEDVIDELAAEQAYAKKMGVSLEAKPTAAPASAPTKPDDDDDAGDGKTKPAKAED